VSVCAPQGFSAAGVAAGIKASGDPDVAVVVSDRPATAAGVFTTNLAKAAPVLVSLAHLDASPSARAVVCSSGNANAATGAEGRDVARRMCAAVADVVGCATDEVLIAQTGLIGIPLDDEVAVAGARTAAAAVSPDGAGAAALAMLTTDTVTKQATATFDTGGVVCTVGAMAKGAAMLAPSMATMLAVCTTDADVAPDVADMALRSAMDGSFHSLIVDGNTSTNDTVVLLANGAARAGRIDSAAHPSYPHFAAALATVCASLAEQMARDAEGADVFATVRVTGARSDAEARLAARAVAGSVLFKCSLAGRDAYWGRVLADIGASGAVFDPESVTIAYNGIVVCADGTAASHDAHAVGVALAGPDVEVTANLGAGDGEAFCWACDLTHAYLDENMGTS
jgi:glutamate N-acetyltransferase/amino-acid N-acetyltransferase